MRHFSFIAVLALAVTTSPLRAGETASTAPIIANPDKPPVELVYTDALDCAAFAGLMTVLLEEKPEFAEKAEYFDKVGDLWLDALIRSDPSQEQTVITDFKAHVSLLAADFKTRSEDESPGAAVAALIDANSEKCFALEQSIFAAD